MKCIEFDQQVDLLLDGGADTQLERALNDHVGMCQSCASQFAEMQAMRTLLRQSTIPNASKALDGRVKRGFQNRYVANVSLTGQPWWRQLRPLSAPTLATSLLAVIIALLLGIGIGRVSVKQAAPPPFVSLPPTRSPKPDDDRLIEPQLTPSIATLKSVKVRHERKGKKPANAAMANSKPLESLTVISPKGANYTTRAALSGFQPVNGTSLRVIKGGEEK